MVTINDEQTLATARFRLVRIDDGRVLMTRDLRQIDAESFNRTWSERGIPTRWERLGAIAAVA